MKPTSAVLRIVAASCCLIGALFAQTGVTREESHPDIATPGNPSADTAVPQKVEPSPKQAPLVSILISATDASGNPFVGLGKDQLTIVDSNAVVQAVQLSKGADVPLHLGIVLFSSPSTLGLYNSHHLEASFSEQKAAAIEPSKRQYAQIWTKHLSLRPAGTQDYRHLMNSIGHKTQPNSPGRLKV